MNVNVSNATTIVAGAKIQGVGATFSTGLSSNNAGTLSITSGALSFTAASTNAAGGKINLIDSALNLGTGSNKLTNNGRINLIDCTVNGDIQSNSGGVINTAGNVTFNGNITGSASVLAVSDGVTALAASGNRVAAVSSLTIDGTLNVNDNKLIVAGGANPAALMNSIRNLIVAGRNVAGGGVGDGSWDGNGITSGSAHAAFIADGVETRVVAYALNSQLPLGAFATFGGQSVGPNDVLVRYTRNGDANLDGVCGDDDVTVLGAFYDSGATTGHQWYEGDFNFDGKIDDSDVTLLGAFYDQGAAPLATELSARYGASFAAAFEAGQAMPVPEPSCAALLLFAAGALAARRRSRH
jgi:hypothetical protein